MSQSPSPRLERSCGATDSDWIRIGPSRGGLERIEARFAGHGFDPHRHDHYTIAVTLEGLQAFGYRGAERRSRRGQVVVLHPDEVHDGHAGTPAGFRYRALYVEPRLIQGALAEPGLPLPFMPEAVSEDRRLLAAIWPALDDLDRPLEPLQQDELLGDLADALTQADPSCPRRRLGIAHRTAVARAQEFLDANITGPVDSTELEAVSGLSRYSLTRHFRACLGTSPHRYQGMRRLERARHLMARGHGLADVAAESGFADQSHMTRQFKRAYGQTPGRWLVMTRETAS